MLCFTADGTVYVSGFIGMIIALKRIKTRASTAGIRLKTAKFWALQGFANVSSPTVYPADRWRTGTGNANNLGRIRIIQSRRSQGSLAKLAYAAPLPICQGALLSERGSRLKAALNFQQAFDVEAATTAPRRRLPLFTEAIRDPGFRNPSAQRSRCSAPSPPD